MTESDDEEQTAFLDAVRWVAMSYAASSFLLTLDGLTTQHERAIRSVVKTLAAFTASLQTDFRRLATIAPRTREPSPRPEGSERRKTGKPETPHDRAIKYLGFTWAAFAELLSMPNRLNNDQRSLAFAVQASVNDFLLVDFSGTTPKESAD